MPHCALIIDDEADIRELIAMSLDRIGLDTHTAGNLSEARNLLNTYQFDVCLTDMKLPDGNGVEFLKHVLSVQPNLPVAVVTAHGNMDAAVEAMKNGAFDFVSKPVDLSLLRSLVAQAIKTKRDSSATGSMQGHSTSDSGSAAGSMQSHGTSESGSAVDTQQRTPPVKNINGTITSDANEAPYPANTRQPVSAGSTPLIGEHQLIGHSEPMLALKKMIYKVARTNAPVWITGESGTGKELIARLIHENGPRADSPFVAINCGAIPSELMESEMFGHRKGSFTGAHSDHDGLFRRAEGGTLFLDEVAELPLHMQVKLLRTIQERKVRPVGDSNEISTNVRILSASHKDLSDEVDRGLFRHDLYYRLNVICIRSPSLRDRGDDIVIIARHILHSLAHSESMLRSPLLTPEAETLLSSYSFPGNVRELENILERAVALSDTDIIEAADLNLQLGVITGAAQIVQFAANDAANDSGEREAIVGMLTKTRWNRKLAAEKLGLTYRQLRYRIKQYGIDEDEHSTGT